MPNIVVHQHDIESLIAYLPSLLTVFISVIFFLLLAWGATLPWRVFVVLAFGLAFILTPLLWPLGELPALAPALTQMTLAAGLGLAVRMVFSTAYSMANILAPYMGLSFAALYYGDEESTPLALLFLCFAGLLFLSFDGPLHIVSILAKALRTPTAEDWLLHWVTASGQLITDALLLSLPLLVPLLVLYLTIVLMSRLQPAFHLFSAGLAFLALMGWLGIWLLLPVWRDALGGKLSALVSF